MACPLRPLCSKVHKLLSVNHRAPAYTGMTPDHRQDKLIRYTPEKEVLMFVTILCSYPLIADKLLVTNSLVRFVV